MQDDSSGTRSINVRIQSAYLIVYVNPYQHRNIPSDEQLRTCAFKLVRQQMSLVVAKVRMDRQFITPCSKEGVRRTLDYGVWTKA